MLKTCGDEGDKEILVPCLMALVHLEPEVDAGVGTERCCDYHDGDDGDYLHSWNVKVNGSSFCCGNERRMVQEL